ncbi:MAG: glucosamine-6-phosphate deaminase [Verrucomicrobiales bacterium]|nr:glucosamine-6-phosphate deaminase [Verrucomicrobiales bacterium]
MHDRYEKIPVQVYPEAGEATRRVAAEIADLIQSREDEGRGAVLGLATGSTPIPVYRELIRLHREEGLSFANVTTFNLDEYSGLDANHPESYTRFMQEQLFDHVDIEASCTNIPNATGSSAEEKERRCAEYEQKICEAGGIDIQLLGIGRSGHIGFNEPGSPVTSTTRVVTLDRITRLDASADFQGFHNVPRTAVTMGVSTILKAEKVFLLAWGKGKADVVRIAVEEQESEAVTASFLQRHDNAEFVLDEAAAGDLTRIRYPWLVDSIVWTPRMQRQAISWASGKTEKPILKLVDDDYNESGLGELIAEGENSYSLNIATFNDYQNTVTGWPGGKPGANDETRPEKSDSHPKRAVIFSAEPQDALVSMGATINRLKEQGHLVTLVALTSGDLRVRDQEALKLIRCLQTVEQSKSLDWQIPPRLGDHVGSLADGDAEAALNPDVRHLKSIILRAEVVDSAAALGISESSLKFLGLPFYDLGRFRQFHVTEDDHEQVASVLEELNPNLVFLAGSVADPMSPQGIAFQLVAKAIISFPITTDHIWTYRHREEMLKPHEIDMAIPISPVQHELKANALQRLRAVVDLRNEEALKEDRAVAGAYDELGLAEYEAMEVFHRLEVAELW